jgi:DNA polymerase-3 subunit delta'
MSGARSPRQLLQRALAAERLPHALLFTGPEGTGKRETALWLAQALLCAKGSGGEGCGRCRDCTKATRGSHPDLIHIEPDGQFIKIEQVRGMARKVGFKPLEAKARVVVFIDAHRMNEPAANALLKTLEEPHPNTTLLLITAKPDVLLPTIRSRVQRLAFRPQGETAVARTLVEQDGVDAREARLRASYAEGSLEAARQLDMEAVRPAHEQALELLELAAAGRDSADDVAALMEASRELSRTQEDTDAFLKALKLLLRDAAVSQLTDGDEQQLMDRAHAERSSTLGRQLGPPRALRSLERIEEAEDDFRHNASRRLVLDALLLDLWRASAATPESDRA